LSGADICRKKGTSFYMLFNRKMVINHNQYLTYMTPLFFVAIFVFNVRQNAGGKKWADYAYCAIAMGDLHHPP
jgi:hypothetical protein